MDGFVARQNIEHFRELLKTTTDLTKRRQIEELLLAEETKLKNIEDDHASSHPRVGSKRA